MNVVQYTYDFYNLEHSLPIVSSIKTRVFMDGVSFPTYGY